MKRKFWFGAALVVSIFGTAVLCYPFWARYRAEKVLSIIRTLELDRPAGGQLQEISKIVQVKHSTRACRVGTCQVYSFLVTNGWISHSGLVGLKAFGGEIGVSDSERLIGYTLFAGEGWADTMIVYKKRAAPLKPFTVANHAGVYDTYLTDESWPNEKNAALDLDLSFLGSYRKLQIGRALHRQDIEGLYVKDDELRRYR